MRQRYGEMIGEDYGRRRKSHFFLIIIIIFIGILGFLVYTSFYNPDLKATISGKIIKSNYEGVIGIDSSLNSPEKLEVDSKIKKVELKLENGDFYVGKEKFDLSKASIIIDGYNGKIIIDGDNVIKMNGKAEKVFVQGLPITSNSEMRISLENADYGYLKLNDVSIGSLNYKASGVVRLNKEKIIINLDDEDFKIERFRGDLEIGRGLFKLKGKIEKSNLGLVNIKANAKKSSDKSGAQK